MGKLREQETNIIWPKKKQQTKKQPSEIMQIA